MLKPITPHERRKKIEERGMKIEERRKKNEDFIRVKNEICLESLEPSIKPKKLKGRELTSVSASTHNQKERRGPNG